MGPRSGQQGTSIENGLLLPPWLLGYAGIDYAGAATHLDEAMAAKSGSSLLVEAVVSEQHHFVGQQLSCCNFR
jgi:hypothetical protein